MKTAYPSTHTTCTITLYCNVPFDNTYQHHTMISSLFKYNGTAVYTGSASDGAPCERFLNRQYIDSETTHPYYKYPRYQLTGDFNFNFSNGLLGSVVLELTAEQTNANFMKLVCGSDTYYYFITGISQINADTYSLSLELDVLMTYQDELLKGMNNIPVFTTRKHCTRYTSDGLMPYCADFKTGDDAFAGVKPNLIVSHQKLRFKNNQMHTLEGVMWLYICCDGLDATGDEIENVHYTANGKTYPLIMLALPLGVNSVTYEDRTGTLNITYSKADMLTVIKKLIGAGYVHGAKISPYPPFVNTSSLTIVTLDGSGNLTIGGTATSITPVGSLTTLNKLQIGNNIMYYGTWGSTEIPMVQGLMTGGALLVSSQNDGVYPFSNVTNTALGIGNLMAPKITTDRYLDPKLLFNPFRKYYINAQYSGQGSEFFPELLFSDCLTTISGQYFSFESVASAYIGDMNFYTYVKSSTTTYDNYPQEKIGLASAVNYTFPCGTNALDVFNATQAQAFYQSKTASGITSGLTIAGGIASTIVGVVSAVGSYGVSAPASAMMIAGGASAIASGVAGVANTIKSVDAKVEDLKNTPDAVNVSGSNYITDEFAVGTSTHCLPYLDVFEVSNVIKENANDYFYNYGYQVARECFLNTELKWIQIYDKEVDTNLFGRTIFNYIQIHEDITNKIDANIPYLIKQKISKIFNNGITIWNFFNFTELWGTGYTPQLPNTTYDLEKWFMKCKLDNTEYTIMKLQS